MLLALLALLACDQPPPTSVVSLQNGVVVTGPTYLDRARAAWAAAPEVTLSAGGQKVLTEVKTPVLVDVPARTGGVPAELQVVDLSQDPALLDLLTGTDEKAAAEAIRKKGIKTLLVHSDLRPSFDRTRQVLSRLYHHDALDYFQLARVENGALLYLVTDGPLSFPPEVATSAIAWVRASLAGQHPPPYPAIKAERSNWRIVTTLRRQGWELAFSLSEGDTLDKALQETVSDLETFYRRNREVLGFPRIEVAIPELTIEMHRVTERAYVVPRDERALEDLWEPGIDGAILLDRPTEKERAEGKKGQSAVYPGAVAVNRSFTRADQFLKAAAREFKWDSTRPWRDEDVELYFIRTVHWVEVPGKGVVPFYRGTVPVPLEMVNLSTVRDAVVYAGEWYLANLQPDGTVTYKYWPEDNRYSNEYNHVRHTLATWNLWQAWTLDPRPEFLEGAIRAQNWTLKTLVERDARNLEGWELERVRASPMRDEILEKGMAYYHHANNNKLGSVVVGILGMIEVARATGDHQYDELLRKFGRFILLMQEESGKFRGYHVPREHPAYNQPNDIVPGEAALALVYLYEYFDDPRYLEPLPKFFAYYQPWFEERAARRSAGGPWPAYTYANQDRLELVQFGPWTVMAASAYTRVRPDEHAVAEFGLKVGRWMVETYEYTEDRAPFPDYVGGYYKFEGELPAMQAFCYAEGTAAAYDMALRMKPEEAPYFELATRQSLRLALQMQHDGLDTRPFPRPLEIMGGIKYAMNEPKVRIDYVHHALSALYQWLQAAKTDPQLPAVARAEPDEAMRAILALQDMPSFRPPGAPVRTSVPANPDVASRPIDESAVDEDDGGGE